MTMAQRNTALAACSAGAAYPTAFTNCDFEAAHWVVWGCGLPSEQVIVTVESNNHKEAT